MRSCIHVLACAALALAGCFGPSGTAPEKRFYAFDVAAIEALRPEPLELSLAVRRVRVAPRYEGQSFVYRRDDFAFESDYYHQFLIAPGAMLTEELRRSLATAGLFRTVVGPSSAIDTDFSLEAVVNDLHADWRDPKKPRAVLELELFLLDESGAERAIRLHRTYRREIELEAGSQSALVAGWSAALRAILAQWATDLEAELAQADPAQSAPSSG